MFGAQKKKMDEELLKLQQLRKELESERNEIRKQKKEDMNERMDEAMECVVKSWLQHTVRLSQYVDNFLLNGFDDMNVIQNTMNMEDLDGIGIKKLGHKKKIMMFIDKLKDEQTNISSDDAHSF